MTSKLLASAAIALTAAGAAWAGDVQYEGEIYLTTDYVFRGISQTNEDPAIQGGFSGTKALDDSRSIYAGVWGSTIAGGNDGSDIELDFYAGYAADWRGVSYDVGAIYYAYPENSIIDTTVTPPAERDLDYFEVYAGAQTQLLRIENATVGASLFWSPDYFGESGSSLYAKGGAGYTFNDFLSGDVALGYQTVEDSEVIGLDDDYLNWEAGLTFMYQGFDLDLRYHGSDAEGLGGTDLDIADDRAVLTLGRRL